MMTAVSACVAMRFPHSPASGSRSKSTCSWAGHGHMVYLDFHGADGQRIVAQTASVGTTADWQTVSVEGTAPDGTAYVTVILYSTLPNVGTVYFDNVRLYDVSQRPSLVERAPTNRELGFLPEDGAEVNVEPAAPRLAA